MKKHQSSRVRRHNMRLECRTIEDYSLRVAKKRVPFPPSRQAFEHGGLCDKSFNTRNTETRVLELKAHSDIHARLQSFSVDAHPSFSECEYCSCSQHQSADHHTIPFAINPFTGWNEKSESKPRDRNLFCWSSLSKCVVPVSPEVRPIGSPLSLLFRPLSRTPSFESLPALECSKPQDCTGADDKVETIVPSRNVKRLPREIVHHLLSFLVPPHRTNASRYASNGDYMSDNLTQTLIECATVSRLWSQEAVRWIWRDVDILCHGFSADKILDQILAAPSSCGYIAETQQEPGFLDETEWSTMDCRDSGFGSSMSLPSSFERASIGSRFSNDTLPAGKPAHPYDSYMRRLNLEIAFPSLDDASRCTRLILRLRRLTQSVEHGGFKCLERARVALTWFPSAPSAAVFRNEGGGVGVWDEEVGHHHHQEDQHDELDHGEPDAAVARLMPACLRDSVEFKRFLALQESVNCLVSQLKCHIAQVEFHED
ncbi:hypothetical protein BJ741DRAFT_608118 [Chytriomyces cf. hyalinus JEL632]|nr:hypothetical protein BJ741DRAFT_608118 [Chytriomyces cf. hyalinus JEL632]